MPSLTQLTELVAVKGLVLPFVPGATAIPSSGTGLFLVTLVEQ